MQLGGVWGKYKSLLCVYYFGRPPVEGRVRLVILSSTNKPRPDSVAGAAQLSLDVLNLPVAVTPRHQRQHLFSELTALLWSHVRFIRDPVRRTSSPRRCLQRSMPCRPCRCVLSRTATASECSGPAADQASRSPKPLAAQPHRLHQKRNQGDTRR